MKRNRDVVKRIFFSDVHMGDSRSVDPKDGNKPYAWFSGNRIDMLAAFLNTVCAEVDEVIMLGDFFDEWVCPATYSPVNLPQQERSNKGHIQRIVTRKEYKDVVVALRTLSEKRRVLYLRGNHDMVVDNRTMEECFPKIACCFGEGGDTYHTDEGILWAEHGHQYALFNAPHPPEHQSNDPFQQTILPLGFFVSRLDGEKALRKGKRLGIIDLFMGWLGSLSRADDQKYREYVQQIKRCRQDWLEAESRNVLSLQSTVVQRDEFQRAVSVFDRLIKQGFITVTRNKWAPSDKKAVMNGFAGIPDSLSWTNVVERYRTLFSEWEGEHKVGVENWQALIGDTGSLSPAALAIFRQSSPPKIVVLGHTHNPVITLYGERIYVNTGAWENKTPRCTYAEATYDTKDRSYTVALKEFGTDHVVTTIGEERIGL